MFDLVEADNKYLYLKTLYKSKKVPASKKNVELARKFESLVLDVNEGFYETEIISLDYNSIWRSGYHVIDRNNYLTLQYMKSFVKDVIEKMKNKGFTEYETYEMAEYLKGRMKKLFFHEETMGEIENYHPFDNMEKNEIIYVVGGNKSLKEVYVMGENYRLVAAVKTLNARVLATDLEAKIERKKQKNLLDFLDKKKPRMKKWSMYVDLAGPRGVLGKIKYEVDNTTVISSYFVSRDSEIIGRYYDGSNVYHVHNDEWIPMKMRIFRREEPEVDETGKFKTVIDLSTRPIEVAWISETTAIKRAGDKYLVIVDGENKCRLKFNEFPWEYFLYGGDGTCL